MPDTDLTDLDTLAKSAGVSLDDDYQTRIVERANTKDLDWFNEQAKSLGIEGVETGQPKPKDGSGQAASQSGTQTATPGETPASGDGKPVDWTSPDGSGYFPVLDYAGRAAKDVAKVPGDMAHIALGGPMRAVQSAIDLLKVPGDWIDAKIGGIQILDPDGNLNPQLLGPEAFAEFKKQIDPDGKGIQLPNLGGVMDRPEDSNTAAFLQAATQFMTGFLATGGIGPLKSAATAPKTVADFAKETGKLWARAELTDFAAFDGQEGNLANLAQLVPALQGPITDFLATNEETPELEGRLKNALANAPLNLPFDLFVRQLRAVKEARKVKALTGAETYEEAAKKLAEGGVPKADMQAPPTGGKIAELLGNENEDIVKFVDPYVDQTRHVEDIARALRGELPEQGSVATAERPQQAPDNGGQQSLDGQIERYVSRMYAAQSTKSPGELANQFLASQAGKIAPEESAAALERMRQRLGPKFSVERQAAEQDQLGFYSKALESARALKQDKGTPEQMRAQLRTAGVKESELQAVGLDKVLEGKKSVTKDEIVQHLESNRVRVQESTYVADLGKRSGGYTDNELLSQLDLAGADKKLAKWGQYSLDPSNPTYRETVLHLPSNTDQGVEIPNTAGGWGNIDLNGETMRNPEYDRVNFTSGHWSEPNVVAHTRTQILTDANGRKVFNIDELQSDWGQKLRDGGARDEAKIAELQKQLDAAKAERDAWIMGEPLAFVRKYIPSMRADDVTAEDVLGNLARIARNDMGAFDRVPVEAMEQASGFRLDPRMDSRLVDRLAAEISTAKAATPGHPLVNTTDQWTTTALRRLIRQAVESGADAISLTPGKVQAQRFNLSKQIDELVYYPATQDLQAFKGGQEVVYQKGIPPEKLPEYVGKEVANRLINSPTEKTAAKGGGFNHTLKGLDLDMGGEGMKATYDQMYPRTLGKMLAKIDPSVKQELAAIKAEKYSGDVISFPLTDKIKQSVAKEGFPLFSLEDLKLTGKAQAEKDAIRAEIEDLGKRLPEGVSLRIEPRRATAGEYDPVDRIMYVSLAAENPARVFRHEEVHALRDINLIPESDWALLTKHAEKKGLRKAFGIDEKYGKLYEQQFKDAAERESILQEEVIAEMVSRYNSGEKFGGKVDAILKRVKDFLRAVRDRLGIHGFRTVDDVFEGFESGAFAKPKTPEARIGVHDYLTSVFKSLVYGNEPTTISPRLTEAYARTYDSLGRSKGEMGGFLSDSQGVSPKTAKMLQQRIGNIANEADTAPMTRDEQGYLGAQIQKVKPELTAIDGGQSIAAKTEPFFQYGFKQDNGASITATQAYEHYVSWAEANKLPVLELPKFSEAMAKAGYIKQRMAGRVRYVGIDVEDNMPTNLIKGSILKPKDVKLPGGAKVPGIHLRLVPPSSDKPSRFAIDAFHGSPHDFEKFDKSKIGTGEGAQAFGHGLYFAESEGVARSYKASLAKRTIDGKPLDYSNPKHLAADYLDIYGDKALDEMRKDIKKPGVKEALKAAEAGDVPKIDGGHVYKVRINANPEDFLDWDKPISAQPKSVQRLMRSIGTDESEPLDSMAAGDWLSTYIKSAMADPSSETLESMLQRRGIRGIRYLDQMSRGKGGGTANYVVFDDSLVEITHKDGRPVAPKSRYSLDAQTADPQQAGTKQTGQVYINWARINSPEDVNQAMQMMADHFAPEIEAARRGVRTNAMTEAAAGNENAWKLLIGERKGNLPSAEEQLALRQLWASSGTKVMELAKLASTGGQEEMFAFRRMMAVHNMIQQQVIGIRTETARALQQWSIPAGGDGEKLRQLKFAIEANGGEGVTRALAERIAILAGRPGFEAAVDQMIQKGAYAKSIDTVREIWINSILSGPKTHIVNMMSNSAVVGQSILERAIAGRLGDILDPVEGVRIGEATAMMYGVKQAQKDALTYAAKTLRTGESGYGRGQIEGPRERAISAEGWGVDSDTALGKGLDMVGSVVNIPGRMLTAEDEFFKTINYRAELWAQSYRQAMGETDRGVIRPDGLKTRMVELITDPPENLRLKAADMAAYNTFQSEPGDISKTVMRFRSAVDDAFGLPIGTMVMPFINTPGNIMKYTFERTPLAPLMSHVQADIRAGGSRRDLALARIGLGTILVTSAYDLAMDGHVTGSGPDGDRGAGERQLLKRSGWQPYSIRIRTGGTDEKPEYRYVAYNRMDPIGSLFGMSAELAETMRNDDGKQNVDYGEVIAGLILGASQTYMNKSYFSGVAGIIEAMQNPDRYGEAYMTRILSSFVPTAVAEAARWEDPIVRHNYDTISAIKARIPSLSATLPPRLNFWGEPMTYQSGMGSLYDLVSPIYTSSNAKAKDIDKEFMSVDFFPTHKATITIDGKAISLRNDPEITDRIIGLTSTTKASDLVDANFDDMANGKKKAQLNRLMEFGEATLPEVLKAVISGSSEVNGQSYTEADTDEKKKILSDVIRAFRSAAQTQAIREFPDLKKRRADIDAQTDPLSPDAPF